MTISTQISGPLEKGFFMKCGDRIIVNGLTIEAMPCDHGQLTPDALGYLITLSGKRIYIAGDTAFHEDYFSNPALHGVDAAILPINGAYGNLNEEQAAEAAKLLQCKRAIPCHFWCFAEHGGNPMTFINTMKDKVPEVQCELMKVGTHIIL